MAARKARDSPEAVTSPPPTPLPSPRGPPNHGPGPSTHGSALDAAAIGSALQAAASQGGNSGALPAASPTSTTGAITPTSSPSPVFADQQMEGEGAWPAAGNAGATPPAVSLGGMTTQHHGTPSLNGNGAFSPVSPHAADHHATGGDAHLEAGAGESAAGPLGVESDMPGLGNELGDAGAGDATLLDEADFLADVSGGLDGAGLLYDGEFDEDQDGEYLDGGFGSASMIPTLPVIREEPRRKKKVRRPRSQGSRRVKPGVRGGASRTVGFSVVLAEGDDTPDPSPMLRGLSVGRIQTPGAQPASPGLDGSGSWVSVWTDESSLDVSADLPPMPKHDLSVPHMVSQPLTPSPTRTPRSPP